MLPGSHLYGVAPNAPAQLGRRSPQFAKSFIVHIALVRHTAQDHSVKAEAMVPLSWPPKRGALKKEEGGLLGEVEATAQDTVRHEPMVQTKGVVDDEARVGAAASAPEHHLVGLLGCTLNPSFLPRTGLREASDFLRRLAHFYEFLGS